jgi:hypothetical protein
MNMPRFAAEASLYRTLRHYKTGRGRQAVSSSAQMHNLAWPALEIIPIEGCPAGSSGSWPDCWTPPLTEPPTGGGGGGNGEGPDDGPEDGVPTGGGKRPPKQKYPPPKGSKLCGAENPVWNANAAAAQKCEDQNNLLNLDVGSYQTRCGPGNNLWCCYVRKRDNAHTSCERIDERTSVVKGGL